MKCLEIFYTEEKAQNFVNGLTYEEADPEIIHTWEPDDDHGTETEEIVKDFEENELSDWWGVTRFNQRNFAEFTDFATREEAEKEFAAQLGNDIYCKMHDC